MLTGSYKPFVVEHRVGGVDFLDLPSLDLGRNSNLTFDDMTDLRLQGIAVDDGNKPTHENIT